MANKRGYEALNIQPSTKAAFDDVQNNEPIVGNTQDATLRHLLTEAGYGDYITEDGDG